MNHSSIKTWCNSIFEGLFYEAFKKTKKQMGTSLIILLVVTVIFALVMWWAEHRANPDFDLIDGLVWTFVKYVEDPAEISTPPITAWGQFVGTLVGILGIAIFAVPAGLISSGLVDAMEEQKRNDELKDMRERIRKAFRRDTDKLFNDYLKKYREKDARNAARGKSKEYRFVPQEIPVYKMQARQNMLLNDIIDCCKEYPEIRLKNMAQIETATEDLFVVEYAYLNRCYGARIDRGSKVTIVSTSSYAEKGTGWFAYYLALMGGFNFVSKDVEVDVDDQDPFYSLNKSPRHDMKTLEAITGSGEKPERKLIDKLMLKQGYRDAYLDDLARCHKGTDSWYIVIKEAKESELDNADFYLNANRKGESVPLMISSPALYSELCQVFSDTMSEEGMKTVVSSGLYGLKENYSISLMAKERNLPCNSFVLRPASAVMNNERKLIVAFRIAQLLSEKLDEGRGLQNEEELLHEDFGFGELNAFDRHKQEVEAQAKKAAEQFMRENRGKRNSGQRPCMKEHLKSLNFSVSFL